MQLNISLPAPLENLLNQEIADGHYDSADELVSEALIRFFGHAETALSIQNEMKQRLEKIKKGEYDTSAKDSEIFMSELEKLFPDV